MPLRQPAAAPEAEPSGPPASRPPEFSLGSQIYARGVRDAQMNVFGALTTTRRSSSVQRRPEAAGAAQALEPAPALSLARTSAARTPVLWQARVQRAYDDEPKTTTGDQAAAGLAQAPLVMPLAPPGPAPDNQPPTEAQPASAAPTPAGAQPPSAAPRLERVAASGNLPLAPVIARAGGNGQPEATVTDTTAAADSQGGAAPTAEDVTPATLDAEAVVDQIDLDELADQLLPYVKRLMAVERERHRPV